nr:hypothetical protein Iba_chr14bCG11750 [Ipomoea batatas]
MLGTIHKENILPSGWRGVVQCSRIGHVSNLGWSFRTKDQLRMVTGPVSTGTVSTPSSLVSLYSFTAEESSWPCARTTDVVVPYPAKPLVLAGACLTNLAPMFSIGSSSLRVFAVTPILLQQQIICLTPRVKASEACSLNEAAAQDIQIQFHLSTSQLLDMSACACGNNNIDFIVLFLLFLLIVKDRNLPSLLRRLHFLAIILILLGNEEPAAAADFIHRLELLAIVVDFHGSAPGTTIMSTVLMLSPTLSMDLLQGLRLKTINSGLMSTLLAIFTDLLRELLLAMEGKNLSNIVVDLVKATERSISQNRSSCLPISEHSNLKESASFDSIIHLVI